MTNAFMDLKFKIDKNGVIDLNDKKDYYMYTEIPSILNGIEVLSISNHMFEHCADLESVIIPDTVSYIGKYAFMNCFDLESINIPNSVKTIESGTFMNCVSLESITLPEGLLTICSSAFENCKSLTSINIPNSVTSIGKWAFYNCKNLETIILPTSLKNIGSRAFSGCVKLKTIRYKGNMNQWEMIDINDRESTLRNKTIYFEAKDDIKEVITSNSTNDCNCINKVNNPNLYECKIAYFDKPNKNNTIICMANDLSEVVSKLKDNLNNISDLHIKMYDNDMIEIN